MTWKSGWMLVALLTAALVVNACNQQQKQAGPKNYLQSESSDARRAMDSMPAPTGGN
jgi:hypothetical protein